MSKKSQHVVPSSNGGWSVRKTGASRASRVFDTQIDAIGYARLRAKEEKSELYIHRRDGTILGRDSYGNDPMPPKG
ncbi:MAG: DUF2188 domain-containing protein [Sulfuricellaceae bacterium]